MVQEVGFSLGRLPRWRSECAARCGGMKLELREEAASGDSRSTARGTSGSSVLMGEALGMSPCRAEKRTGLHLREAVQKLTPESTRCHPGLAWTLSKAVEFAGLELIRRKSLIKYCLKLTVTEFLSLLLKETELFMVCLVLVLLVSKLPTFCRMFYGTEIFVFTGKIIASKKLLTCTLPPCCLGPRAENRERGFV